MTKRERQLKKAFKRMLRAAEPVILAKLMHNERKYKFGWGWRDHEWKENLWQSLPHHVTKGDPRDVIIYGHFALYRGWPTAPPNQPYLNHQGQPRERDPNLPPKSFIHHPPCSPTPSAAPPPAPSKNL